MKRIAAAALLLVLGACGIDGPPTPPSEVEEEETRGTGITITGSAEFGVGGTL